MPGPLYLRARLGSSLRQIEIPESPARLTIGSSARAGLVLPEADAAPEQVSLTRRSGLHLGRDNESSSRTTLNGTPVTFFALKEGDELRIGSVVIQVVIRAAEADAPVPAARVPAMVAAPVLVPERPPKRAPRTRRTASPGSLLVWGVLASIAVFAISWFVETARLSSKPADVAPATAGVESGTEVAPVESAPLEAGTDDPKVLYARAKVEADRLLESRSFAAAVAVWTDYLEGEDEVLRNVTGAHEELTRAKEISLVEFERLRAEVGACLREGEVAEASGLLSAAGRAFEGTPHADGVAALSLLVEEAVRRDPVAPAPEPDRPQHSRGRPDYEAVLAELDRLVVERRYSKALELCRGQEGCPFTDLAARFDERARVYSGHAAVHAALLRRLGFDPTPFTEIRLDAGIAVDAIGGDPEMVVIRAGRSTEEFPWSRIGPDLYVGMLVRLAFDATGNLRLAALAFENGRDEVAHRFISLALAEDDSLTAEAFALLARRRGIPVPEGGFVKHRGLWVTPEEFRALEEGGERDEESE